MSVYSMTGFASAVSSAPDHVSENTEDADAPIASRKHASGAVGAELRSVNSRFLDLSFKLADEFRGLEPALRELLTTGKVRSGRYVLRPRALLRLGHQAGIGELLDAVRRLRAATRR